ncbi:hypothetical protein B0O80DRAFT_423981 [Mortierella sp. GBAus27b]|nr:hypothetical protein B0O80DRAFT_423981 [Mortierella sp. GBAus27b]
MPIPFLSHAPPAFFPLLTIHSHCDDLNPVQGGRLPQSPAARLLSHQQPSSTFKAMQPADTSCTPRPTPSTRNLHCFTANLCQPTSPSGRRLPNSRLSVRDLSSGGTRSRRRQTRLKSHATATADTKLEQPFSWTHRAASTSTPMSIIDDTIGLVQGV